MAKPLISVMKSKGAKNWMQASVFVDVTEVQKAIDAVLSAVSPTGIAVFMREMVAPYMEEQIVDRFADHGGGVIGGSWAPLEQSTEEIRHALGFYDDEAINERTGALLSHLLTHELTVDGVGANLQIPENSSDTELARKLRTAQEGHVQGPNEMIPGAVTPPRPVLHLESTDMASLMILLQTHVAMFASNQLMSIGTYGP